MSDFDQKLKEQQSFAPVFSEEIQQEQQDSIFTEITDYKEDSAEFQEMKHDATLMGGEAEAEAIKERYEKAGYNLSPAELDMLKESVPPGPDFKVLSKEEYDKKWSINKKKYDNKVKDHVKKRKEFLDKKDSNKFEESKKPATYGKFKDKLKRMYNAKGEELETEKNTRMYDSLTELEQTDTVQKLTPQQRVDYMLREAKSKGMYKDIEATPEAMEKAYDEMSTNQDYITYETEMAQLLQRDCLNDDELKGVVDYSEDDYKEINDLMRFDKVEEGNRAYYEDKVNNIQSGFKKNVLNRDLVVRRGVQGLATMGYMFGLEQKNGGYNNMTEDEMKAAVEKKMKEMEGSGQDLISYDKAFMSTALPFVEDQNAFKAEGNGYHDVGVEFVILLKKGTEAMNIMEISSNFSEREVLVNSKTKLKMLKVDFNSQNIKHGQQGSWKVYLEAIPQNQEGVKKDKKKKEKK